MTYFYLSKDLVSLQNSFVQPAAVWGMHPPDQGCDDSVVHRSCWGEVVRGFQRQMKI